MTTSLPSIAPPLMPIYRPGSVALARTEPPEPVGLAPRADQSEPGSSDGRRSDARRSDARGSDIDSRRRAGGTDAASTEAEAAARQEQQVLRQLAARDREVRQHEMAHQAAGGGHTGAASYTFERGPDGRLYAVGGEVSVDTSAVGGDPRATLEKAEAIIRAALAPAEPSPQDYRVAAKARAMAAEARAELARLEQSETDDEEAAAEPDATGTAPQPSEDAAAPNAAPPAAATPTASAPLGRVQQQLVDSGAYSRLYPPGSLFNLQV